MHCLCFVRRMTLRRFWHLPDYVVYAWDSSLQCTHSLLSLGEPLERGCAIVLRWFLCSWLWVDICESHVADDDFVIWTPLTSWPCDSNVKDDNGKIGKTAMFPNIPAALDKLQHDLFVCIEEVKGAQLPAKSAVLKWRSRQQWVVISLHLFKV